MARGRRAIFTGSNRRERSRARVVHVRLPYRITSLLGILAVLVLGSGCGGDDATRKELAALHAEVAELRQGQTELQQAVQRLQSAPAKGKALARTTGKSDREVVRIIPTGSSPRLGPEVAAATVVVFADFQCAFCQAAANLPKSLVAAYPNDVMVVFKNFPLGRHKGGQLAAKAAWAAHQQGKFWEMYDLIYAGDIRDLTPEVLRGHAEQLGLDLERYEADAESPKAAQAVAWDKAMGRRFRVGGTPTYYVNGRLVPERTPAAVHKMVAEEIAKVKPGQASHGPGASANGS